MRYQQDLTSPKKRTAYFSTGRSVVSRLVSASCPDTCPPPAICVTSSIIPSSSAPARGTKAVDGLASEAGPGRSGSAPVEALTGTEASRALLSAGSLRTQIAHVSVTYQVRGRDFDQFEALKLCTS